MNLQPGCIPCIVHQAHKFSRMSGITDAETQKKILYDTLNKLLIYKDIKSAPHFSVIFQSTIGAYTNVYEVIRKSKQKNLREAMKYVNYLTHMIDGASDKLEMAIRVAIAGNTIDLVANPNFNIEKEINQITSGSINLEALNSFRDDYTNANMILIIGDNYEEAVFDKLLIQQLLPKEIVYAVRSNEILNDITMEDAKHLEIDKLCRVIKTGSSIAGVDLDECNKEFLELYNTADIVIAKGQGNYETLFKANRPIYFLFKVKCEVIADICGYPVKTSMLYYHDGLNH